MRSYRVIIAGTRTFSDYMLLRTKMDKILSNVSKNYNIIIVSGAAKGADTLGEVYAKEKGYRIERYPAKWNRTSDGNYNKRAGYERNLEMSKVSNALVAFTNGSKGTAHMIEIMKKANKPYRVINF